MSVTFQRLLSRGELPDSAGGCYNPSILPDGRLLVRREANYLWDQPSYPTVVDLQTKTHTTLFLNGYPVGSRVEDCRAFAWRGMILVSHVEYQHTGKKVHHPVKQRLSVLQGDCLVPYDPWDLPVPMEPIEKNWVLASSGDDLFCVYSLDPFVVCRRVKDCQWEQLHGYDSGLTMVLGKPPRNSTHLIPFDGGLLGFWHFFVRETLGYVYRTGAIWLDEGLHIGAYSEALMDGSWVTDTNLFKRGVLYVSSAKREGDEIRLFYGEGDSHAGVATIHVADLRKSLRPVRR